MMIKTFIVDTFCKSPFSGNPAGVCLLNQSLPTETMQQIANELNQAETAFVVCDSSPYNIRWFTPIKEMPLCGHATLAAAIAMDVKSPITFRSASGLLHVSPHTNGYAMVFPLDVVEEVSPKDYQNLIDAMNIKSFENIFIGKHTQKLVIHLSHIDDLKNITPDFNRLLSIKTDIKGIGITTKGDLCYDFISRYFNPWAGVNEDAVTGSVHTLLAAYWSKKLQKKQLIAYQASPRGGTIFIKTSRDVTLIGSGHIILSGQLEI